MSYDIYIADKEFNITWNLSPFFYAHFPENEGILYLGGMAGSEAALTLSKALDSIERERRFLGGDKPLCEKYDNPNGNGSTMGALLLLARLLAACAIYPRHTLTVC